MGRHGCSRSGALTAARSESGSVLAAWAVVKTADKWKTLGTWRAWRQRWLLNVARSLRGRDTCTLQWACCRRFLEGVWSEAEFWCQVWLAAVADGGSLSAGRRGGRPSCGWRRRQAMKKSEERRRGGQLPVRLLGQLLNRPFGQLPRRQGGQLPRPWASAFSMSASPSAVRAHAAQGVLYASISASASTSACSSSPWPCPRPRRRLLCQFVFWRHNFFIRLVKVYLTGRRQSVVKTPPKLAQCTPKI